MAVSATDTQKILKSALNLTNVTTTTGSELKCLKCSKRAYQSSSYVYCTSGLTTHRLTNINYIIGVLDMYEGVNRSYENTPDTNSEQIL